MQLLEKHVNKDQMAFFNNYAAIHGDKAMDLLEAALLFLKKK